MTMTGLRRQQVAEQQQPTQDLFPEARARRRRIRVGGIVLAFAAAACPEEQERCVELDEPPPGRLIAGLAQALQKSSGCGVNGPPG